MFGSRLNPASDGNEIPRIVDILLRPNEVASSPHSSEADLVFRPSVEAFGVLYFSSWEELIDAGYRQALEALDSWSGTASLRKSQGSTKVGS